MQGIYFFMNSIFFMQHAIGIVLIKLFMTKFITGTMFHLIPFHIKNIIAFTIYYLIFK